ncbi:hypothetical protein, partial [uncultured Aureimonas sp.]|uniref:hypothetical protein n=1 Tax=uncultured Aureimonas sp. TaxID=1604662 RepID=UPI0025D859C0
TAFGSADRIEGFAVGDDILDFGLAAGSATTFATGTASTYDAALVNANAAFANASGPSLYSFQTVGADGWLFVDSDQNGTADLVVQLAGVTNLAASDIV